MKNKRILYLTMILAAVACAFVITRVVVTEIIVLKTGSYITTWKTWVIGETVFYDEAGEIRTIETQTVEEVLDFPPESLSNLKRRFKLLATAASETDQPFYNSVLRPILLGAILALGVLSACVGRWLFRLKSSKASNRKAGKKAATPADLPPARCVPELFGLADVEAFFLTLYRRQIGADLGAPARITSVPDKNNAPARIYKLAVKHNDEWKSRRMTIGPIGEGSHSKSQCFYVIFDTHMVVKIPPIPIEDFSDYIHRIRHEAMLVKKLAPRVCIIPNLSVILGRIHHFTGFGAMLGSPTEENYIRFLEKNPEYQSVLKIGGSFAFFMDLSQHFFLSYVLGDLNDIDGVLQEIVMSDAAMRPHSYDFETKYGAENGQICQDLHALYNRFESNLNAHLLKSNDPMKPSPEQKREWFYHHLAGESFSSPFLSTTLSNRFEAVLSLLLQEVAPPTAETVQSYRRLIRDHAQQLAFNRNRHRLSGMVTNLLDLLVWLGKKHIALRDLKPDNLLVAGKTGNYPLFLLSANNYSIGLIDLETAVDYEPAGNRPLSQPQLGGTPAFSTPSNFISNTRLAAMYKDLSWILQLQDWYAMVGIIYETIAGKCLFAKTRNQIPGVIHALQQAHADQADLSEAYLRANAIFWQAAKAEFASKVTENDGRFDKLSVRVPKDLKPKFADYISGQLEKMDQAVHRRLQDQTAVQESKTRQALKSASWQEIGRIRKTYRKPDTKTSQQLTVLLDDLATLKQRSEKLSTLANRLDNGMFTLCIRELLELLFGIVAGDMDPQGLRPRQSVEKETQPAPACPGEAVETGNLGYTLTLEFPES